MKGATLATRYAALLAESFHLSKYVVGFIVIAVISILPETFIAINSAIEGMPEFGLGTLFGSNIVDLTLVFSIIIFLAGRGLRVEAKILKNRKTYPLILLVPLLLGMDGFYGRIDGLVLMVIGSVFYYIALKDGVDNTLPSNGNGRLKSSMFLLVGMSLLLVGSHFIVSSASSLAHRMGIDPILIGLLIVGVGTAIPELFFSVKSIKKNDDSLAIGDILGTVLADATIVVGLIALISPFSFPRTIIFVTGIFMILSAILLYRFMHSGRFLSRKEGLILFIFWLSFVLTEFFLNQVY